MQGPQNMKDYYYLFGTFGREAVRGNCWKSTLEPDCPFYDLLRKMDFFPIGLYFLNFGHVSAPFTLSPYVMHNICTNVHLTLSFKRL